MVLTIHPYLAPKLSIERAIPGPPHCACLARNRMAPLGASLQLPTTSLLGSNIFHSILLFSVCYLMNVREQFKHPYKITGNIIVFL